MFAFPPFALSFNSIFVMVSTWTTMNATDQWEPLHYNFIQDTQNFVNFQFIASMGFVEIHFRIY